LSGRSLQIWRELNVLAETDAGAALVVNFVREGVRTRGDGNGSLQRDLAGILNAHSAENSSNTPDFILARYLMDCLRSFNVAVRAREAWFGRP
jgi:hypothetical protein